MYRFKKIKGNIRNNSYLNKATKRTNILNILYFGFSTLFQSIPLVKKSPYFNK